MWSVTGHACRFAVNGEPVDALYQLSAFPNPTNGKLNVVFSVAAEGKYTMKLVDVIGKEVLSNVYTAVEGSNLFEIDLSGFAKGIYNLNVGTDGAEMLTMRIVVN